MEEKEIASVRKITGELIGGFIIYGILFALLYQVIYTGITNSLSSDSLVLIAIIAIVLQGITAFCVWRCSIASTFKKRAIDRNDVQKVIKNLIIFTVILCIISTVLNFIDVNKKIDKKIDSTFQYSENFMNLFYDSETIEQYNIEKEKTIREVKTKLYSYFTILQIGLLIVYIGVIPLQKKALLKHAI